MENFGSDHKYHGGGDGNVQDTKINLVFDGANLIGATWTSGETCGPESIGLCNK